MQKICCLNRCPECSIGSLLKGQCHEIFASGFFPPAAEYPIRIISNFFENSLGYSQVKVHHRHQPHRWQICHQCQRTGGKFCHQFASVFDTSGKFASGFNDTGSKLKMGTISGC